MTQPPNVLLVVVDTARVDDVYRFEPRVMSSLMRLAQRGTTFDRAFASAPWTLPSHAALFTGAYSSKHGAHGDHPYLDDENVTIAEAFRDAGYETWAASNNTWISGEFGFDRGFSTFWKGWQAVQSTDDVGSILHELGRTRRMRAAIRALKDGNPIVNALNACLNYLHRSSGDYGAMRTTERVESWLRSRADDRPFFGFVNYLEPHIQYTPPREYAEPFLPEWGSYEKARAIRQDPRAYDIGAYALSERELTLLRALYRGELARVDAQIDRLHETLKRLDIWDDTVLVVLGDHGENIGDHGFLGHQYNMYDTLLHVPLVISGGPFSGGGVVRDLVQVTDIAPTLLDVVRADTADFRAQCQGESFHPDRPHARDAVFAEYISPHPPVATLEERFGDLPAYAYAFDRRLRAVRTKEEKLIRGSDGHIEYYDVAADPDEREDLAATETTRVASLEGMLDSWMRSFEDRRTSEDVTISNGTRKRLADLGYM